MLWLVSGEEGMLECQSISAFMESIHIELCNKVGYLSDEAGHLSMPKVAIEDGLLKDCW